MTQNEKEKNPLAEPLNFKLPLQLAVALLKGAPPATRAFVSILLIIAFLALAAGSALIVSGHTVLAYKVYLAALGLLFLASLRELGLAPLLQDPEAMRALILKKLDRLWSVTVPRPAMAGSLAELGRDLEDIRRQAHEFLQPLDPNLQVNQVRANVFLPDYGYVRDHTLRGIGYMLTMHPDLMKQMNHEPEKHLAFYPGQGATGQAAAAVMPFTVSVRDDAKFPGGWPPEHQLMQHQIDALHPDLRWIVSFALCPFPDNSGSMVVLNVDGLGPEPPAKAFQDRLYALEDALKPRVKDFETKIKNLPQVQLVAAQLAPGE